MEYIKYTENKIKILNLSESIKIIKSLFLSCGEFILLSNFFSKLFISDSSSSLSFNFRFFFYYFFYIFLP